MTNEPPTNPLSGQDEKTELQLEKCRRIYYQSIVYDVCNRIEAIKGIKVTSGKGIVCGHYGEPSNGVQEAMLELQSELAAMTKERDSLRGDLAKVSATFDLQVIIGMEMAEKLEATKAALEKSEGEAAVLRHEVEKFGTHGEFCAYAWTKGKQPCDCRRAKALSGTTAREWLEELKRLRGDNARLDALWSETTVSFLKEGSNLTAAQDRIQKLEKLIGIGDELYFIVGYEGYMEVPALEKWKVAKEALNPAPVKEGQS